jgi:hypothetical protein
MELTRSNKGKQTENVSLGQGTQTQIYHSKEKILCGLQFIGKKAFAGRSIQEKPSK